MFTCPPCASKSLPGEFRHIAEELFPPGDADGGKGPSAKVIASFAGMLGIGEDFARFTEAHEPSAAMEEILDHFQNNLDLLIQKTWVEKADEERKEKLLDEVPVLIGLIEKGDCPGALEEFGAILEELAYLFFGEESQKDDFAEYALRIDTQMGLFWWYGGQLGYARDSSWVKKADRRILESLLLLGICYLTNF